MSMCCASVSEGGAGGGCISSWGKKRVKVKLNNICVPFIRL